MSAITNATAGVGAAFGRLDRIAEVVAQDGPGSGDLCRAAADLVSVKVDAEADAAVRRTGTRMSTHLVDILV